MTRLKEFLLSIGPTFSVQENSIQSISSFERAMLRRLIGDHITT